MDPDLILIFSFVIIVTAISGVIVNGVVKKILDYKREKNGSGQPPARLGELSERTAMIEDRLMVLERIATDPEARRADGLAEEIERLRIEREQA